MPPKPRKPVIMDNAERKVDNIEIDGLGMNSWLKLGIILVRKN